MTITPSEATARYRLRHPERVKANRKKHYAREQAVDRIRRSTPEGWAKARATLIRHRAKARGLECTITWRDILPPPRCPVLGLPLQLGGSGRATGRPNAASVDRRFNDRGYTPENVRVISLRANLLKKDATLTEIACLAVWMEKECAL